MSSPAEKQPEGHVPAHLPAAQPPPVAGPGHGDPFSAASSPASTGTLLYLAADLLWATRIKETATALGIAARPVRTLDMLEARLADTTIAGLIIDLEAGDIGLEMIHRLRGQAGGTSPAEARIPIVVFGPHVAVDRLEAARRAVGGGASAVMARGAFSAQLPGILTALARGDAGAVATRLTD
jgi:hypothetical protein